MKHQYDNKDIQAAIDAALENTDTASKSIVTKFHYPNTWKLESKARLSLLKTALDLLPEPRSQNVTTCAVCNWTNVSLLNLGEPGDLRWVCPGCCKRAFDQVKPPVLDLLAKTQLSILRPISEAGEVPAGCVRVSGWLEEDGWYVSPGNCEQDTHFADIRLPEEAPKEEEKPDPYAELKAAHAAGKAIEQSGHGSGDWFECGPVIAWSRPVECYRIKPEPYTFEAHGKTWTRHTPGDPMPCDGMAMVEWILESELAGRCSFKPNWNNKAKNLGSWSGIAGWRYADEPTPKKPVKPWTPAVGDVVKLKSNGPKMTVMDEKENGEFWCRWFHTDGTISGNGFPAATLIPA